DPFPQDAIEARLRAEGGGANEWMSYLRTRLRIARSIAVLGPLVGLSLATWTKTPAVRGWSSGPTAPDQPWVQLPQGAANWAEALVPLVIFFLGFAVAQLTQKTIPRTDDTDIPQLVK